MANNGTGAYGNPIGIGLGRTTPYRLNKDPLDPPERNPVPPASIAAPTRTPAPITMVAVATMPGSAPARSATDQAILDGTYVAPAPTNALPPPPVAAPTPAAPAVTDHNPFFANLIDRGLSSFKGMFDGVAKQYAALHAPQPQGGGVGTIGANGLNPQQLERDSF